MSEFVCVRLVQANTLDLSLFQFDYDMSFAVFFLAADKTVLGRYGTRSAKPKEADRDISLDGLREAMEAALSLHGEAARRKYAAGLAAKRGPAPEHATPLELPGLERFKPTLDYQGKVAQSCVHCHQILDARRRVLRDAGKPIPDRLLFPWPNPRVVGLELRKDSRATVASVAPGSPADLAGLRAGDELGVVAGQPVISVADIQWVLHQAGDSDRIEVKARRAGGPVAAVIELEPGWREASDLSWRVSSWELRRMAFGGMLLERDPAANPGGLSLRAVHVGQYGDHAVAKRAGVVKGDVLVAYDGIESDRTESELMAHAMRRRKPGDVVPIKIRRDGEVRELTLRLQ